jgi:hypothetical protein
MSRSFFVSAVVCGLITSAGVSAQSLDDNSLDDNGGDRILVIDDDSLDDNGRDDNGGNRIRVRDDNITRLDDKTGRGDGRVNGLRAIRNSGKIIGTVQCDTGEAAPAGTLVFIAGDSFMSRTDELGNFRLRYVTIGNYELTIETPDQAFTVDAEVEPRRTTDLGVLEVSCGVTGGTTTEICDDFIDNDGDTLVDIDDTDCATSTTEICDDFIDNDGDGLIDLDDTDCATSTTEICDDFIDNDGDGLIDASDTDCATSTTEICDDFIDNDGDGLIDVDDPDCAAGGIVVEDCFNFVDDDADGLVDASDTDCAF